MEIRVGDAVRFHHYHLGKAFTVAAIKKDGVRLAGWREFLNGYSMKRDPNIPRVNYSEERDSGPVVVSPYKRGDWAYHVNDDVFYRVADITTDGYICCAYKEDFYNYYTEFLPAMVCNDPIEKGSHVVWNGQGALVGLDTFKSYKVRDVVVYTETVSAVALENGGPLINANNFNKLRVLTPEEVEAMEYKPPLPILRLGDRVRMEGERGATFIYDGLAPLSGHGFFHYEGRDITNHSVMSRLSSVTKLKRQTKTVIGSDNLPLVPGDKVIYYGGNECVWLDNGEVYVVKTVRPIAGTITLEERRNTGYSPRHFIPLRVNCVNTNANKGTDDMTTTRTVTTKKREHDFYEGQIVILRNDDDLECVGDGDKARVTEIGTTRIKVEWLSYFRIGANDISDDSDRQQDGWYAANRFEAHGGEAEFAEGD